MFYDIKPVPKPRQTRSDKWKKRPCVLRYRAFKDEVKLKGLVLPEPCKIIFFLEMPRSWSQKRRDAFNLKPHRNKPDIDNLIKAVFDALHTDDSHIWQVHAEKRWSDRPGIMIEAGAV